MDHISDALIRPISKLIKKNNIKEDNVNSKLSQEAIDLVNALFSILSEHVKYFKLNKINHHDRYLKSKREWVKTFQVNNVTQEQVSLAVDIIRKSKDTIDDMSPGEFMRLFKSKTIPKCHQEHVRLSYSNPAKPETVKSNIELMKQALR